MCDFGSAAATSSSPNDISDAGTRPSGGVAPCCSDHARFEGTSRATLSVGEERFPATYAFDPKTNLPETAGTDEYWSSTPVAARGDARPGDSDGGGDGAPWVSVPVGRMAEVEINFGGGTTACIGNATYELTSADVATVVTAHISTRSARFRIRGAAAGETTLVVKCDGNEIGWYHIWCAELVELTLNVVKLISDDAPASNYSDVSVDDIRDQMNDIFKQALLTFNVIDRGEQTLNETAQAQETAALAAATALVGAGSPVQEGDTVWDGTLETNLLNAAIPASWRSAGTSSYTYALYFGNGTPRRAGRNNGIGGTTPGGLGSRYSLGFQTANATTMPHEFGHMLGLAHPSDPRAHSQNQIAHHLIDSLDTDTVDIPGTATEPAYSGTEKKSNVMARDPLNLMGYTRRKSSRKMLRIDQCIACRRS